MKRMRIVLILVVVFLSGVVSAQEVEERSVGSFDEIRVAQAITVYLQYGTKEMVRVEARGIDLKDVLTEVSGGRLKIHLDDGRHSNVNVKVYVTYKSLSGISASSASGVFSEEVIKGDRIDISVSSAVT